MRCAAEWCIQAACEAGICYSRLAGGRAAPHVSNTTMKCRAGSRVSCQRARPCGRPMATVAALTPARGAPLQKMPCALFLSRDGPAFVLDHGQAGLYNCTVVYNDFSLSRPLHEHETNLCLIHWTAHLTSLVHDLEDARDPGRWCLSVLAGGQRGGAQGTCGHVNTTRPEDELVAGTRTSIATQCISAGL